MFVLLRLLSSNLTWLHGKSACLIIRRYIFNHGWFCQGLPLVFGSFTSSDVFLSSTPAMNARAFLGMRCDASNFWVEGGVLKPLG